MGGGGGGGEPHVLWKISFFFQILFWKEILKWRAGKLLTKFVGPSNNDSFSFLFGHWVSKWTIIRTITKRGHANKEQHASLLVRPLVFLLPQIYQFFSVLNLLHWPVCISSSNVSSLFRARLFHSDSSREPALTRIYAE